MSYQRSIRVNRGTFSMRKVTVAACTLNQWALDFDGNLSRIMESIHEAKEAGARFRTGPELEICGYSCEDHFYEGDTLLHCWEVLCHILDSEASSDMIVDVGMPVMHKNVTYNCRVILHNKQILMIRPKLLLCDDGNYRESRWFSPWKKPRYLEDFYVPRIVHTITGKQCVPFGDGVIATEDTCIGFEICEELWNPHSSHIAMGLDGVEIISNSSGSYMELRKAYIAADLIKSASMKSGGCYIFSNLRGCDGQRTYFNGCSCIALNGEFINYGQQFSLKDIEVVVSTFDLEDIHSYRNALRSRCNLSSQMPAYPRVHVAFCLSDTTSLTAPVCGTVQWRSHTPEEEIAMGPACWLWDYLRRSSQGGFFLPLSGGVDSASTACIVFSMCKMVYEAIQLGDYVVLMEVRRLLGDSAFELSGPQDLCTRRFVTCYMGTENSSSATRERAAALASQIGSLHLNMNIDRAVSAVLTVFTTVTRLTPKFTAHGGSARENIALQNIQARVRMVVSYLFAQLTLWVQGRPGGLLVLGSANVDEALRGYMTKYDCSSADINPIGGISKNDLRRFLLYAQTKFDLPALGDIMKAAPTAELEPLQNGVAAQTDEQDMGITYDELSLFGRLRKQNKCGPFSMFCKLLHMWKDSSPEQVSEKVKHFFRCYALNRHKMTVLTPSVHAESYSPDDNRFDHRPFLYNVNWTWQFKAIDEQLEQLRDQAREQENSGDSAVVSNSPDSAKRNPARGGNTILQRFGAGSGQKGVTVSAAVPNTDSTSTDAQLTEE